MLAAERLAFGYRGARIGAEVSLALAPGEKLCVLGPNGGGKTTLFKTLLGLIAPLGGAVRLNGQDLHALPRAEIARTLAYVPQAHASFFPFTVADIVLMGRAARVGLFAAPGAKDRRICAAALARLGIERLAERPYTELSGGERQLTLIARALAQQPAVLVMDEPTASLDLSNQARVLEQIGALSGEGLAILFSTHDPDHAFICADRVALMRNGAVTGLGAPDDIVTAPALRALYGVEIDVSYVDSLGRKTCAPVLRRGGH